MKRSEMLEKLEAFLRTEKIVSINAAPILDFLESEGMLPPSYYVDHVNSFGTEVKYPIHGGWEFEKKFKIKKATAKQIREACGVTKEEHAQAKKAVKKLLEKKK